MQGGDTTRERFRRLTQTWSLWAGYIVGSLAVVLLAGVAERSVPFLSDQLTYAVVVVLLIGDVWAIAAGRMYPWGPKRQARKSLMYSDYRRGVVGWVWGFDAGTGLTTYRMTSGTWLLIALVASGRLPPIAIAVPSLAFVLGLILLAMLPVQSGTEEQRTERASLRVAAILSWRRPSQAVYFTLACITAILYV